MTNPLSLLAISSLAERRGGKLLSGQCLNVKQVLKWECAKGHIFEKTAFDIKYMKYWCPQCVGRHTEDDYRKWASRINATYLGVEKSGKFKKIKLLCVYSHEWLAHPSHTKQGHGCPHCKRKSKLSIQDAKTCALSKNGQCLSSVYESANKKLKWECSEGHQWMSTFGSVNNGAWCSVCANASNRRWSMEDAVALANSRKGILISNEFTTRISKYEWRCSKNHVFNMSFDACLKGRWCPKCRLKSEQKTRDLFEDMFERKFPSRRPKWLFNAATGGTLCLDGFCEELKLAFEYDGEQHFMEMDFYDSSLSERQANDALKDCLCKHNGVTLVRIPYFVEDTRAHILSCMEHHPLLEGASFDKENIRRKDKEHVARAH